MNLNPLELIKKKLLFNQLKKKLEKGGAEGVESCKIVLDYKKETMQIEVSKTIDGKLKTKPFVSSELQFSDISEISIEKLKGEIKFDELNFIVAVADMVNSKLKMEVYYLYKGKKEKQTYDV